MESKIEAAKMKYSQKTTLSSYPLESAANSEKTGGELQTKANIIHLRRLLCWTETSDADRRFHENIASTYNRRSY